MGGFSFGIGTVFSSTGAIGSSISNTAVRETAKALAHGLLGSGFSAMQGGNAWSGFMSGAFSSGVSSLGAPVLAGLSSEGQYVGGLVLSAGTGAASSALTGGDPWMGAAIAAIGYATNQAMHQGDTWRTKHKEWDKNRDGKMQKSEADARWKSGKGGEVYVDNSKIDWTGLEIPAGKGLGDNFAIKTSSAFWNLPWETSSTYGGTSFRVVSLHPKMVEILDQSYHYEYRPNNSIENAARNFGTWIGHPGGQGADYMIHYYNNSIIIR